MTIQRLPSPMLTPTMQYEGTIEGNRYAMTAPGSPNTLPVQNNDILQVPQDMEPSAEGSQNVNLMDNSNRIRQNTPTRPGESSDHGWTEPGSNAGGWKQV